MNQDSVEPTVRLREKNIINCVKNDLKHENEEDFKALYVIIFSNSAEPSTLTWILDLLSRPLQDGGAELLVRTTKSEEGLIVEITATTFRLLEAAEALEITKEDKNGYLREFIFSSIDLFLKPGITIHNVLSTSEKQRIILEEIIGLISMDKKTLVGYPDILLFPGQSIIQVCKNHGIIMHMFPLHEPIELNLLKNKWSFFKFASLPLNDIRNYFGEAVAFYFAFICFYTWALLPPAIIGIIQTIISFDLSRSHVFFAILKMIWLTLFLVCWKRRGNELAFSWGTLRLVNIPKLHPTFRGKYVDIDPVTKQHIPMYPAYKRHLKVYCVSLPLVTLCLIVAMFIMFGYFQMEKWAIENYYESPNGWIIVQVPGIAYAVLVILMNTLYRHLATFLTEWENHKTQESFDNHRIVKLLLFEFINNFAAMGYIAFYEHDLDLLKWQIAIMMIVNQVINQFQEAIVPLLLQKSRQKLKNKSLVKYSPRIQNVIIQSEMWSYEGTYDDYLEMFIQFGYVFLFSSVFPIAASLAIINNVVEIWVDGFKLCYSYQRPHARPVKGIGVWQLAFEVLSFLAVISNSALIAMSPIIRSYAPDMSLSSWLLIAVTFEHILIAIKMVLSYVISDVPKWVKVAIQRAQYESVQALKIERKEKTKEMLKFMKMKNIEKLD